MKEPERLEGRNEKITVLEAYRSMYAYLEIHLRRFGDNPEGVPNASDVLSIILSELSFLPDGAPLDPAVWFDWLTCVRKARSGDVNVEMRITPPR